MAKKSDSFAIGTISIRQVDSIDPVGWSNNITYYIALVGARERKTRFATHTQRADWVD